MIIIFNNGFKLNREAKASLALANRGFEGLALLGSFLSLEFAVGVEVKLLVFDHIVTRDVPFLSSA
jgi:hypothetical protein